MSPVSGDATAPSLLDALAMERLVAAFDEASAAAFASADAHIEAVEARVDAIPARPCAGLDALLETMEACSSVRGDAVSTRLDRVVDATVLDRPALEQVIAEVQRAIADADEGLDAALQREAEARASLCPRALADTEVEVSEYRATLAELEALEMLFARRAAEK